MLSDIDLDGLPSTEDEPAPTIIPDDTPPQSKPFPALCYGAFIADEDNKDRSVENNVRTYNAVAAAHMSIREMALDKVATALSMIDPGQAASDADTTAMLTNLANTAMSIAGQNEKSVLQVAAANKRLLEKSDDAKIGSIVTAALLVLNRNAAATSTDGAADTSTEDLLAQVAEQVEVPVGMLAKSNEEGLPPEYAPK